MICVQVVILFTGVNTFGSTDNWFALAPDSNNSSNAWGTYAVGINGPDGRPRTCRTHGDMFGPPGWGTDANLTGFARAVKCCNAANRT